MSQSSEKQRLPAQGKLILSPLASPRSSRSSIKHFPSRVTARNSETLCRLLRFLLRRVGGEELLLAEQKTHEQAFAALASLLPGLNITEAEAETSGSTARPSGVDHERDDQVRCPVLLPWGNCMVIKHAGGMVVKVPGKYEGTNHTFNICPTKYVQHPVIGRSGLIHYPCSTFVLVMLLAILE